MRQDTNGNALQFLLDGEAFFGRLGELLRRVRDSKDGKAYVKLAFWKANEKVTVDKQGQASLHALLNEVVGAGKSAAISLWQPETALRQGSWTKLHAQTNEAFFKRLDPRVRRYHETYEYVSPTNYFSSWVISGASTHQKIGIFCFEGEKYALVGGMNMEPQYIDTDLHDEGYPFPDKTMLTAAGVPANEIKPNWHDAGIMIAGPAVDVIEAEWDRRWNKRENAKNHRMPGSRPELARIEGIPTARSIPSTPVGQVAITVATTNSEVLPRQNDIRDTLKERIKKAGDYVYLESFTVFDPGLVKGLVKRLGQTPQLVPIVVVPYPKVAGEEANGWLSRTTYLQLAFMRCDAFTLKDGTVVKFTQHDQRAVQPATDKWLTNAVGIINDDDRYNLGDIIGFDGGACLYSPMRLKGKSPKGSESLPIYVHSKVALVDDGVAVVGSANWNYRSMEYDGELSVFVVDGRSVSEIRKEVFAHFGMPKAAGVKDHVGETWRQEVSTPAKAGVFMKPLQLHDFPAAAPGGQDPGYTWH